jgi:predicted PurR-regulated permease PerM
MEIPPPRYDRISLSTSTLVRFFLIALLIAALYYLSDVVLVVLAAIVIASAIEPVVRRLMRYRLHRIIVVVLIYLLITGAAACVLVFFLPAVLKDVISFLTNLPQTVSIGDIWAPLTGLTGHAVSVSDFIDNMRSLIVGSSAGAFQTASIVFGGLLSFVLIIVLSFYLAVQEDGVAEFLRIVTPVKRYEYIIDLWQRSQRKIGYWLQGQVILGAIIALLVYVTLVIVGIPHPLLLALFAGALEIIPIFGPIVSAVPAVLVAHSASGIGTAVLVVFLYLIIHQLESNFFYPLVVRKVVGVSPIVVILALIVGYKFAGVLGAVVAVPLSAAFMEYVHDVQKRKKGEHDLATVK